MSNVYEEALKKHEERQGKNETKIVSHVQDAKDITMAKPPGVDRPCREIHQHPQDVYRYTGKGKTVAVITDGTAVLGLGDIGPQAALPVMEGKCVLFKRFADVNAVPICLDTKDPQEIIKICKALAPAFGGFNLEDISAPRCVEIERTLKAELDIPVFHDDQHGTAICVTAALINALKVVGKKAEEVTVVVSGTGAAGSSIIRMLHDLGVKEIYGFNINGIVLREDQEQYDFLTRELCAITNSQNRRMSMSEALQEADVFVGVSAPKLLTKEMVSGMKKDPIIFAMANPEPEISVEDALAGGARIVGTGRSDFPNQVNNVLAFPGLFKGALSVHASKITEEMKMAAALGIASLIDEQELSETYVIPSAFDPRVADIVAAKVAEVAIATGIAKKE